MSGLTFLEPWRLLLLLLVAAGVVGYVLQHRRRPSYALRFSDAELLASVAPRFPGWRKHLTAALLLLSLAGMTAAFAKPEAEVRVSEDVATIVVALDVSASMMATDVAPDRVTAAKAAAATFVEGLPDGFEVGLVSFASAASLVMPPTDDHDAVVEAVRGLALQGGTAIGEAVAVSVQAVAANATVGSPTSVVLLSDGANTQGRPVEEGTAAATAAGVPVTTIAYGTQEGTVTLQGRTIAVPADRPSLEALATATGGTSYGAENGEELAAVYADIGEQVGVKTERREVTATFVGLALLAGFAAAGTSLLWGSRLL